ncbi:succinate dehydrogenase flavoprotein subunit [bacterium]|nr:succinate dehydrogenase flavoprotein subunit [bacterium]NBX72652.1 succinate dehydrogenase flavoprotein subunit [bacterium]
MAHPIPERVFDALIIGAGGAGLRAALQLVKANHQVAVVSKVFPTRSHTVSAQGGITAALGNIDEDNWHWHMFDTVKGSDYLGDQDAIEYMCRVGPECVYELEHMGLPFSRLDNGKIYQRPFGGQSKDFGKGGQATRTSAAADRTGHALLHTLFQQNLKHNTIFFNEWIALDLVMNDQQEVCGVTVLCLENGERMFLKARAVVLATGGAGQVFSSTTNAYINTGDGLGMALRAGIPLQDMEMWQFHPTGISGSGCLITEGARGEGGYLVNKNGERFMERYAPHAKDLASRDVVSRSIATEIREGRGCGSKGDYIELKLEHLGADLIKTRLPGIRELSMTFANVDPVEKPIPIVPTCHYMMGGIPTNKYGQVLTVTDDGEKVVSGLYAVGECACVSVHGANRLGGNSLLDLVVFGRAAGLFITEQLALENSEPLVKDIHIDKAFDRLNAWELQTGPYTVAEIRTQIQEVMQNDFGVFRQEDTMHAGLKKLLLLKEQIKQIQLQDKSQYFNTARLEALELDNLIAVSLATAYSAIERKESRGAHFRNDYPQRHDQAWLKHVVCFADGNIRYRNINFTPVLVDAFEPKARTY